MEFELHLQNVIFINEHTGSCTLQEKYGVHRWQAGTGCLVLVQMGRGGYTAFQAYLSHYFFCVPFFFFLQKKLEIKLRELQKLF